MKTAGGIAGEQIVLDPERLRALLKTIAETRAELARLRSSIGTIAFMLGEESPTTSTVPATLDWLEFEGRDILRRIATLECRNVNYDFVIDTLGISSRQRLEATAQLVLQRLLDRIPEEPIDPHTAADAFGFIPIAGDYVDGAHAVWYATEGDWENALWSGVSVVPVVGSLVGQTIKHGDDVALLRLADDLAPDLNKLDEASLEEMWGNPVKLDEHVSRHAPEFGLSTKSEYLQRALEHLVVGAYEGWPAKVTKKTLRIYNPHTNTIASYRKNGKIRTFFKPDPEVHGFKTNLEYWEDQKGRPVWGTSR